MTRGALARRSSLCAAALALAACAKTTPPRAVEMVPIDTARADRSAAQPSPDDRDARLNAALARVPAIAERVAEIRGLLQKQKVAAAYQPPEAFRAYVKAEIRRDLPPEKSAALARSLARLGFLRTAADLGPQIESAFLSQAGAYYSPEDKKFFIVIVPKNPDMLDVLSAHELTHAIDDQHFDLVAYMGGPGNRAGLSDDALSARRFVAEGEASLVMLLYQTATKMQMDLLDPANRAAMESFMDTFGRMDAATLTAMAKNPELVEQMGPEVKASLDAIDTIPPFILTPLFAAYTQGAIAVYDVVSQRGAADWDAVSELYRSPPQSTEQMLHPRERLIGQRDLPVLLTLPPVGAELSGFTLLASNVLGELLTRVYFDSWGTRDGERAAAGWGGDRYAVYAKGDHTIGFWASTWDSPRDATEFVAAYEGSLGARFPGGAAVRGRGYKGVTRPDGTVTVLAASQKDVRIVDGCNKADAARLVAWLSKTSR